MAENSYGSPAAFRRALTDKLKSIAADSRWELPQLQRLIAYDRLLERLYMVDDQWIVKGATALLARDLGVRGTIVVDIYRAEASDTAEVQLREAADRYIGDWFRFEIGPSRAVADGASAIRLPVKAFVGTTVWVGFHVDLVGADVRMTGQPEDVPPLAHVAMPDVEQHGYRAYPLVDHIADKIAATFDRYGEMRTPSTRFKDLVDLVAIIRGASTAAIEQGAALASEAGRRGLTLPDHFGVPDVALWEPGYRAEAERSLLPVARTLEEALAVVCPFIDPLLSGIAGGRWDPAEGRWM
jgi:hypothetical protein